MQVVALLIRKANSLGGGVAVAGAWRGDAVVRGQAAALGGRAWGGEVAGQRAVQPAAAAGAGGEHGHKGVAAVHVAGDLLAAAGARGKDGAGLLGALPLLLGVHGCQGRVLALPGGAGVVEGRFWEHIEWGRRKQGD